VRARGVEVVVSSFDLATIDAAIAYAPELASGFLVHRSDLQMSALVAHGHGHEWLHPDRASVMEDPARAVTLARQQNLRVDVWTVDDPDEIRVLAAAGVDAIITNVPDVALAALD
jgi:glycerophosphoryl diester phosphodiesterase